MRTLTLLLALTLAAPAFAQTADEHLAAAGALYDAKKYAEAAQRLDQLLAGDPPAAKVGVAAFTLGRCYTELRQWAKAIPAYEKALASMDAAVAANAQLGLCEAAVQAGAWEKAAAALDAAVKGTLKPDQAPILWFWRGQAHFQLGHYPQAEESYLKVAQEFASSDVADGAFFGAGVSALRQKKADAAKERLQAVVTKFPMSEDRPRAMLVLAQIELDAGRFKEAREAFEALEREPALTSEARELQRGAQEGLVRCLLELQDYANAAKYLDKLLPELPAAQRSRAYLTLGNCHYRLKQYPPALQAYTEAAKSADPGIAAEGLYWSGNVNLAIERPVDAAAHFAAVAQKYPTHALAPRAQLKAADALAAGKKPDQAVAAYRKVIEAFPSAPEAGEAATALADLTLSITDPTALAAILGQLPAAERGPGTLRLARLHLDAKQPAPAETVLVELLKTMPAPKIVAEGKYLLGLASDIQQKPILAMAMLSEAIAAEPTAPWVGDAQGRLAWVYLELKEAAKAEKAAEAVLALKPGEEPERQARLALVQAYVDQGKWEPAIEVCRTLLQGKLPEETVVTILFTQAWATEKSGKVSEAVVLWERLVTDYKKSEYTPEALLHVGDARFKAERFEEARGLYSTLVTEHGTSPFVYEARFKLGSALFNLNRFPDASAEWDRVLAAPAAGEWAPEALYWTGVAQDRAGNKAEAAGRFERLIRDFPKHPRVVTARVRLSALKAVLGK